MYYGIQSKCQMHCSVHSTTALMLVVHDMMENACAPPAQRSKHKHMHFSELWPAATGLLQCTALMLLLSAP